jgi:hypothetical protein
MTIRRLHGGAITITTMAPRLPVVWLPASSAG